MGLLSWFRDATALAAARPAADSAPVQRVRSEAGSRAQVGLVVRASVDLVSLLCTALRPLILQAASREVRLLVQPAMDFPDRVSVDGLKVAWALTSLVGNALRFTRRGGVMLPGGTVRVKLDWDTASREVVLEVTDDGSGIPPALFKDLLSRDLLPERVPSLQLLLVEDLAHAHGGSLEHQRS